NATWPNINPARITNNLQRRHHCIIIVQRLAHPHEHEVAQLPATYRSQSALRIQDLPHDFSRPQMAHESHLPCRTKNAPHRAARLCADTGRVTSVVSHQHRLNRLTVREPEQKLPRQSIATLRFIREDGSLHEKPSRFAERIRDPSPQRTLKILPLNNPRLRLAMQSAPQGPR